jgi:hypothetical protein
MNCYSINNILTFYYSSYVLEGILHVSSREKEPLVPSYSNLLITMVLSMQMRGTLEVGCEGSLMGKTFCDYKVLVTPTWITHTWEFLGNNNMQILDEVADLTLDRENNQFLIRAL